MTNRSHPVRQLYEMLHLGKPTVRDLDEAGIPAAMRPRVLEDIRTIRAFRDRGENGNARDAARSLAEDLIDELPDELAPPGDELPTDPRELADRIGRT